MTSDFVIVGGGVVALGIALSLQDSFPDSTIMIFEKENQVAAHASGRNSGVLHAGFYYSPDSLKAQLTQTGNLLLREFCAEENVDVNLIGKLVVARNSDELQLLNELLERGAANGVHLELIDEGRLFELEPLARTYEKAIWSPTTGVADPTAVLEAMVKRFTQNGGILHLGMMVVSATHDSVVCASGQKITFGHLINCAGLHADTVAHWFDVGREYQMLPFKGLYWYGNWKPGHLSHHVYPVPDPRNPFLGVHLTVTIDGNTKLGPTAIPAMWREDYGGLRNFSLREISQILSAYPSFLFSTHHDVPKLIRDELPKYLRRQLVNQAKELVPSIKQEDFKTKGRIGVRAQLLDTKLRKLEMDFVVRHGLRSTHILNAVSPAWTSSLAVGKHVVREILAELG